MTKPDRINKIEFASLNILLKLGQDDLRTKSAPTVSICITIQ